MKKITTYLLVGLMSMLVSCSFAQDADVFSPKFKAAKMYVNSDFDLNKNSASFVNLLRTFSPSIAWGKEYGNFHEISAQDFGLLLAKNQKIIRSSIDYSYNMRVGKYNRERKVNFYAGAGVRVGANFLSRQGISSTSFNDRQSNLRFDLVFTPRMTIKLGKRSYLDISIPYSVYSSDRDYSYSSNPSNSVQERKSTAVKSTTFPNQFTVRVGVAFKF